MDHINDDASTKLILLVKYFLSFKALPKLLLREVSKRTDNSSLGRYFEQQTLYNNNWNSISLFIGR